tara:strand:- start:174 stop:1256 length:1083 start_codon:yes stop_codon:yes gene_type:complete
MKGLILSGGKGMRLRPLTNTRAKQLVPIANKPILFYCIEQLEAAGITEIGIIIGETGDEVKAVVGDGSKWGVDISWIPQEAPLGLAHCVLVAREFLGNDDFVMFLGDNMLELELESLVHQFINDRNNDSLSCRVLLKEVENPSLFGVGVIDDEGRVTKLIEKPKEPPSNLALVGVYFFTEAIHDGVLSISPSKRGELEITDAIQWLIDNGFVVDHQILDGWWIDTGKKDPLLECNRLILSAAVGDIAPNVVIDEETSISGTVQIGEGSVVSNSIIEGPVLIGKNVTISSSYIRPFTSIGDEVRVSNSTLENSVLLEGCVINRAGLITASLVGSNSKVSGSTVSTDSNTLLLGDNSIIDLS